MTNLTKAQRIALKRVYDREPMDMSYLQFRRTAFEAIYDGTIMVWWSNMMLGIEKDGYTHS